MALNVGENFKQRWLNTPEAVRQTFCDELQHISVLLEPDTVFTTWQQHDTLLQHQNRKQIKHAYEELKQQIIAEQHRLAEERKQQRQKQLEERIEQDRTRERERIERLRWEEIQRENYELQQLEKIAEQLQTELKQQTVGSIAIFDTRFAKQFNQQRLNLDDIQLRLEIESDAMIEQLLAGLRIQLKSAAQEEIQLLISTYRNKLGQNSNDSD